ncbi:MAG TPA: helix-turn-helix transcriptional regulator [Ktedonobacterales bacterium]|jgi:transcriptional regulator with XRE-family HTH domain|nr:helix-turn-helix transcriptional regulator [Ktedonobacterales bacterium]
MLVAEKIRGVTLPHLRAWRIAQTISQTELAEKAHVSRATITRAERGEIVSFANVRAIAAALDVTVKQLQTEAPE